MSRGTPIEVNRSLLRPILFCGAEKMSTCIYGLLSFSVIMASNYGPPGIYAGPAIFIILHMFFVRTAKKDPQMIAVYLRHVKYKQGFYPAGGGACTNPEKLHVRATVDTKRRTGI
jgi:type IV secretory pathway TrbD component